MYWRAKTECVSPSCLFKDSKSNHCFLPPYPNTMASEKVETVIAGNYVEMEREEGDSSKPTKGKLSTLFWHGGSVYDAWFSCASNQAKIQLPHFSFCIFISYPFCYYYFFLFRSLMCFLILGSFFFSLGFYRLLKCFLHFHIHFHNWGCFLGFSSNSSMV